MEILIQMVPVTPDVSLFIYGFNEKGEMIFRSSAMPKYLQNETIVIDSIYKSISFSYTIFKILY